MKTILLALLTLTPALAVMAQPKPKVLKKVAELKMPKTADDDSPGTRGASVAWHPVQKKYYAAMAGNSIYPMAVFDAIGKRLSSEDQASLIDTRGLWYNAAAKTIQGNAYDKYGWFAYKLNAKGLLTDYETLFEGQNQPTEQCVGAYNAATKKVLFLKGSQVTQYYITDASLSDTLIDIHFGRTAKQGAIEDEDLMTTPSGYNTTTVLYTGLPKASLGFLNAVEKQIELYDPKTGFLTQTLKLPADAPAEESFNLAYANGIYWLFNMEKRTWMGYK